jgi:hypothetical protein
LSLLESHQAILTYSIFLSSQPTSLQTAKYPSPYHLLS